MAAATKGHSELKACTAEPGRKKIYVLSLQIPILTQSVQWIVTFTTNSRGLNANAYVIRCNMTHSSVSMSVREYHGTVLLVNHIFTCILW